MKEKCETTQNFVPDENPVETDREDFSPQNNDDEVVEIPERWHGSARAMAKFIEKGLEDEALLLNCFMVIEIKKHSVSFQEYEKLYKNWSEAVNSYDS